MSKKAGIYVRVSTEEQAKKGVSLQAQEEVLRNYCKTYGFKVYKIYKDEGKSAKNIRQRPEMLKLLEDAEKKKIDLILIYKLDRFSRSLKDLILTIEKLKKWDVDFVSIQDKIETTSATGKLMFHIISAFAEFERAIIGERTRFGMEKKARDGAIINRAPLGYKIQGKQLIVDPEGAKRVQEIFKTYHEWTSSLNQLAAKYKLSTRGLIKLLSNKTYIGMLKFGEEWHKGTHKAILNESFFNAVNKKLSVRRIKPTIDRIENIFVQGNVVHDNIDSLTTLANFVKDNAIKIHKYPLPATKIMLKNTPDNITGHQKQLKYIAKKILEKNGANPVEFETHFQGGIIDVLAQKGKKQILVKYNSCGINETINYLSQENTILWIANTTSIHKIQRGPKWWLVEKFKEKEQEEIAEEHQR